MSEIEAAILCCLIAYSVVVGAAWGCLAGRRETSRGVAAIGAVATAMFTSLAFFLAPGFVLTIARYGLSFDSLVEAVKGSAVILFFLMFTVPWITVLPSFGTAMLMYGVARRRRRRLNESP